MNCATPSRGRSVATPFVDKFVALRRRLLNYELEVATLVGRKADADSIRAELRSLDSFPGDALMHRAAPGKLVARSVAGGRRFEQEMEAVERRMKELEAEVRQWEASRRKKRR